MGTSSGAEELNHECVRTSVPIIYFRNKTWIQMFYFDSNMTLPLKCAALGFLDSVCCQDVVWLTVPWDPNKFSFQTLIKL